MKPQTVLLGYEVGTGTPIEIPVQHLAVTGQTQLSGKTTTLEALVTRSGLSAIAFTTKRGEGSFTEAHQVAPYFRERADWQFVSAVLEASLRERLKFERSWIMRACKGAKTLNDVHCNVREAMVTAKGMSADVYLTLDHYLEIVTPQIEHLEYSDTLKLKRGVNVMDLSAYTTELQSLVIRSVIEWVYENGNGVLVIIPEAWEFIPQNRGSPVLLACETLIRKGGNLKNFVWLDSQDIAGVHKNILRQVGTWILGVQREANEVKRALNHIPGGTKKPSVDDVMGLERGQFFACFGKTVAKVYVQPAWMTTPIARGVAMGNEGAGHEAEQLLKRKPAQPEQEVDVKESEARALREENARLKRRETELEQRIEALKGAAPTAPIVDRGNAPVDIDAIYAEIKRRAAADPGLVRILTQRPELEVAVERPTIQIDGATLQGRVARLIASEFFAEGATNSQTRSELKRTGSDVNNANLARVLADFQRMGFLTLESGERFRAVRDMKVNIRKAA